MSAAGVDGTWRLVVDEAPADGAGNMALDRALLESHAAGQAPPTLRLYRWVRPTVTLGRFQDAATVDAAYCAREGIDVVRRATGGRGVLHDDELTYSVVAGVSDGVPRGVAASYRRLCAALLEAYRALGVPAQITARPRGHRGSGACYLHATQADLSIGAAKLSGSAQVWLRDSVLQHGSFVRTRDVGREARAFMLDDDAARSLSTAAASLEDLLGVAPDYGRIQEAVVTGFERALGISLVPGRPTTAELRTAEELTPRFALDGLG